MAVHHQASIGPTTLELLQPWVPHQPWLGGADASVLTKLGSYRFDDPDGEVGTETHLLQTADGPVQEEVTTHVRGSGAAQSPRSPDSTTPSVTHDGTGTRIRAGVALTLQRVPVLRSAPSVLSGTWPGQAVPLLQANVDEPT